LHACSAYLVNIYKDQEITTVLLSLLSETLLSCLRTDANGTFVERALDLLRSSARINIHHELLVGPRHYSDVLRDGERVIELPCRLRKSMFHIADFRIDSHLHSCVPAIRVYLLIRGADQWRVCVDDCGCQIKYTANWHRVLERRRIEGNESRPCVREGGGCRKGKLERLLEEEATENHEMVPVAVLRLHYRSGLETRSIHVDDIVGFAELIVRI
jgi:hypothetical protein